MSAHGRPQKKLFVCTRPYQYLMCRLIKDGYMYNACDLLVLNHFDDAPALTHALRTLRVWERVFFEDDTEQNRRNAGLNSLQKLFFYHNWRPLLPASISSYDEYDGLFLAHDGVATEYGIMRQFNAQGKHATVYEEGFGNYVCTNDHTDNATRLLKRLAHWFRLPGDHIGRLQYIDTVLLQWPEILTRDRTNPLKKKARALPLTLREFLSRDQIREEMETLYPELEVLSSSVQKGNAVAILLGDLWWDVVPNREQYVRSLLGRIPLITGTHLDRIFIKQHPGEMKVLEPLGNEVGFIPKRLPLELFFLAAKGKIKDLFLLSFGSTAILNLHELLSKECRVHILILPTPLPDTSVDVTTRRFLVLADSLGIPCTPVAAWRTKEASRY